MPLLVLSPIPPSPAAAGGDDMVVRMRLVKLVRSLPVAVEDGTGYDRDLYPHWSSQGAGCDTREVVLRDEDRADGSTQDGECRTVGGSWRSAYDGVTTVDSSSFDIDHVVALAEAHASGASAWDVERREAYANDLGDPRSLIAVSASSNRSKSDRDPAEWLPDLGVCRFVTAWTVVKVRWSLTVDAAEKQALRDAVRDCPDRIIRVQTVG
ncbi:MAG: DUF1524 domain-containing protein [Actinobacteria bacterium]|nr:DUF1524 domain-containing protein [Actinomycetota bacterium]